MTLIDHLPLATGGIGGALVVGLTLVAFAIWLAFVIPIARREEPREQVRLWLVLIVSLAIGALFFFDHFVYDDYAIQITVGALTSVAAAVLICRFPPVAPAGRGVSLALLGSLGFPLGAFLYVLAVVAISGPID